MVGRAGAAYRTDTQMELLEAHAAARDAVRTELDVVGMFGEEFVRRWKLFEVCTNAKTKDEYLLRPDLGRQLDVASRVELQRRGSRECDFQIAIGDGLSVSAVAAQVPALLPLLWQRATDYGWTMGRPFVIRYCRVGVLNEIGELLRPRVCVLLIGERPGLSTAKSLSAYMAYETRASHSDANRNLISNIHERGVSAEEAAARIFKLAAEMMRAKASGYLVRAESRGLE
jgi:ethanolamine ammonia-lyase small subunit